MSAAVAVPNERPNVGAVVASAIRRNTWIIGLLVLLGALLVFTSLINPRFGAAALQSLAIAALPLAFAAVAQAICVIGGGIDLSVGSVMALTSVIVASLMKGQSELAAVGLVLAVIVIGLGIGAINGAVIVVTKVPDIVVTLAMSFVWAGCALLVLKSPGGGSAIWLKELVLGFVGVDFLPKAAVVMVLVVAAIWIPFKRSRLSLSIYAIGSHPLAAFRSGVNVGRTKIVAYAMTGMFAAIAGISLTASTGIGTPVPGPYTLMSVAAIVLGGVSLAGGRGGAFGPIIAVVILQLVQMDMAFLSLDTNLAVVLRGVILIGVVMFGSLIQWRRTRR